MGRLTGEQGLRDAEGGIDAHVLALTHGKVVALPPGEPDGREDEASVDACSQEVISVRIVQQEPDGDGPLHEKSGTEKQRQGDEAAPSPDVLGVDFADVTLLCDDQSALKPASARGRSALADRLGPAQLVVARQSLGRERLLLLALIGVVAAKLVHELRKGALGRHELQERALFDDAAVLDRVDVVDLGQDVERVSYEQDGDVRVTETGADGVLEERLRDSGVDG
jgi:hypothetical protein